MSDDVTNFSNIGFTFNNQSAIDHNNATGYLGVGDTIGLQVVTNQPVTVNGTPQLQLSDGDVATYDPGSSNSTSLNFIYTVQAGQTSNDLQVGDPQNNVSGLLLNGGSIVDSAGNALNATVAGDVGILIDGEAPSVTFNPGVTLYHPGVLMFTGSASDNIGVANVEIFGSINGGPVQDLGPADLDGNGNWDLKVDFGGPLSISSLSAQVVDEAGNTATASRPGSVSTGGPHHFVYSAGSGPDVIDHFQLKGPGHDVLVVPRSEFPNLQSLVAALSGTHNVPGGVLLPLGNGDSVTLGGVTKAQLKTEALSELHSHHITDFKFA